MKVLIDIEILDEIAPIDPINQDEQGGCVWCGSSSKHSVYASDDHADHAENCPWVAVRKVIEANGWRDD